MELPVYESDFLYILLFGLPLFGYVFTYEAYTGTPLKWWQMRIVCLVPVLAVIFLILIRMWRFG